jgi:hypothetical protein
MRKNICGKRLQPRRKPGTGPPGVGPRCRLNARRSASQARRPEERAEKGYSRVAFTSEDTELVGRHHLTTAHRRNDVNKKEAHVKGSKKEHDRDHGNKQACGGRAARSKPTGELRTRSTTPLPPAQRPVMMSPPGGTTGVAGVGGVVGRQTREAAHRLHQIHRSTGGATSAERLEAVGATGLSDNSPARLCI